MLPGPELAPAASHASPPTPGPAPSYSPEHAQLRRFGAMPPLQVLRLLDSSVGGLAEAEAELRAQRYGENVLAAVGPPWPARVARAATAPFVLMLVGLAVVSAITRNPAAACVIAVLAAVSCVLQASQESRADRAVAALRAMVRTTATVVRRATMGAPSLAREVPTDQLVPGDVVRLAAGDAVPADVRLLQCSDMIVNQALLTGESSPATKRAVLRATAPSPAVDADTALSDNPRLCLLGSSVVAGSGSGVVVATGPQTYFASTHDNAPRPGRTAFDRGVRGVSRMLIRIMLAAVPAVFAISALADRNLLQALLFAASVAIGLTPEMLPVVVTGVLARGARLISRGGLIVKRLPAVHNLGAMDVLCIDKTGTLTEDRSTVDSYVNCEGVADSQVLAWAALNSEVTADRLGPLSSDPLDEALTARADELDLPVDPGFTALSASGFDPTNRCSTVVVRRAGRLGQDFVVTKGAAEEVLDRCVRVRTRDGDAALLPPRRRQLEELADAMHRDGVTVLAVAVGTRPGRFDNGRPVEHRAMTLLGFIGLRDELKRGAVEALAALAAQGVEVKVVTGDHPDVAARICREAGLPPGRPVRGSELDVLDDVALRALVDKATVFGRTDPHQKARIVRALRSAGRTVGYLGDGVNDVPALRAADVGICVESAADIARDCADVVVAGKDLRILGGALVQVRNAFANIIKYIKIIVSSNIGNATSVVAASVLLPFLPMLPAQILLQNLLFDLSQVSLAVDRVDRRTPAGPRTFDNRDLLRFVACFGLINSLADLAIFAALRHVIGPQSGAAAQVLFHTGWFVENLLTQVLAVHLLRSRSGGFRRSRASRPVLLASAGVVAASIGLTLPPFAPLLGFHPLPAVYFGWLGAVLAAFCLATLAGKWAYQRTFHTWL